LTLVPDWGLLVVMDGNGQVSQTSCSEGQPRDQRSLLLQLLLLLLLLLLLYCRHCHRHDHKDRILERLHLVGPLWLVVIVRRYRCC